MRVAVGTGLGVAKVTYSFDAWKDGKVAPNTIELPVVAAKAVEDKGAK